jgi:hypothetical protein
MTRKISSQKGRCPIIFRFFGVLQDSGPAIQVASVINIVYYIHSNVLKKNPDFLEAPNPMVSAKYTKKAVRQVNLIEYLCPQPM